jgi:hypothetical protein
MKLLYLIKSRAHFSYHVSTIRHLCGRGHSVQALFDESWSQDQSDLAVRDCLADTSALTVGWSLRRSDGWRKWIFPAREMLSYGSYLNRQDQSSYYLERWRNYLPAWVRRLTRFSLVRRLMASGAFQSGLRGLERWVPPDRAITRWLETNRPDAVVASPLNHRFSEDVEYVKAAKALGIPTIVPVLSWDALTTKGLFHVIPDLTLAWNQTQREEAIRIHHVPPDRIVVTGSPFFDKWFDPASHPVERDAFCRKVGLDPEKPFLAYLGSSANIAQDETWLLQALVLNLRTHPSRDVNQMQILARPHPANARVYDRLREEGVAIWPREGALPDTDESFQDLRSTLLHCVATVGVNTSGMIDAILAGKSCVAIMTEQYRPTQLQAAHFRQLLDADALEIANGVEECSHLIARLRQGVDATLESRTRFARDFARPWGLHRPAGDVAAQAIEMAALGQSAAVINATLAAAEKATQVH